MYVNSARVAFHVIIFVDLYDRRSGKSVTNHCILFSAFHGFRSIRRQRRWVQCGRIERLFNCLLTNFHAIVHPCGVVFLARCTNGVVVRFFIILRGRGEFPDEVFFFINRLFKGRFSNFLSSLIVFLCFFNHSILKQTFVKAVDVLQCVRNGSGIQALVSFTFCPSFSFIRICRQAHGQWSRSRSLTVISLLGLMVAFGCLFLDFFEGPPTVIFSKSLRGYFFLFFC